jgi:hypothetical protein
MRATLLSRPFRAPGTELYPLPRALPWAAIFRPFGAAAAATRDCGTYSSVNPYLLNQAVIKVLRFDGAMRAWFKRIKKRRGSKIARVAVMRRLATILWHMLKRRQKYRRPHEAS